MGTQLTGTFTMGATGGAGTGQLFTVDYTTDINTLNGHLVNITTQLTTLNTFLTNNLSFAAAATPKTPAASLLVQASALNMIADVLASNLSIGEGTNGSVSSLNTSLASIAAALSDIGASANIQLAQTIEKNEFEQQATNQARAEAGLPKVEVEKKSLQDRIKNTASTAITVQSMTSTAGLVQAGVNRATATAGNLVNEYITAPAGNFIADSWKSAKQRFGFNVEDTSKKAIVEKKTAANATLLGGQ
jgi:hypothetical protein